MAKLIISSKGKVLQEVELTKTVVIGRETGDIMIKNPAISARHASVEKAGEQFIVKDLGSTNGTYLNDEAVSSQALVDGDVITIGKYSFRFENPQEVDPFDQGGDGFDEMAGRTMVMDTAKLKAMMGEAGKPNKEETSRIKSVEAPEPKVAKLFLTTPTGPKVIKLDKPITLIGSGDNADIQIKGLTIGSVAASITQQGGGAYEIAFQGGMAKLKIDGVATEKQALTSGQTITIGSHEFAFRID